MPRTMGIIAVEGDNINIEGISNHRPIHTVPLMARYKLVDFPISNLSNSGVNTIQVYIKNKPRTVYEHIGSGRNYNINSKHGRIRIMFGEKEISSLIYNTDIQSYLQNIQYINSEIAEYVIVVPSHFTYLQNFSEVIEEHIKNKADITVIYKKIDNGKKYFLGCDSLKMIKGQRIVGSEINRGQRNDRYMSLETYIMSHSLFVELINEANSVSPIYWLKDIIYENFDKLDVRGFKLKSPVLATTDLRSYYINSMNMLNVYASKFFKKAWQVYTRTYDSPPSLYGEDSNVKNSLVANGSVINGEVHNSIIGRDVIVEKGAKIENSIIMSHTYIGEGKIINRAVLDKHVRVEKINKIISEHNDIIYVNKNDKI